MVDEDTLDEMFDLLRELATEFRHHAGDYLADKYHYERDIEELAAKLGDGGDHD